MGAETLANKVKRTDEDCFQNKSGRESLGPGKARGKELLWSLALVTAPAPGLQGRRRGGGALGGNIVKAEAAPTPGEEEDWAGRLGGPGELATERGQSGCTGGACRESGRARVPHAPSSRPVQDTKPEESCRVGAVISGGKSNSPSPGAG